MALDNSMIYCRSCKNLINSGAKRCPQCGAEDPFYFKKIRKVGNLLGIAKFVVPFIFGLCVVSIISPKDFTFGMVLLIGITILGYFVMNYFGKEYFRSMKHDFDNHFCQIGEEKDNMEPYFTWLKKIPMTTID